MELLTLNQIITAIVLMGGVELAKRAQGLNVWKGEKKKIRLLVLGLGATIAILEQGMAGTLADPEFVKLGIDALMPFLLSHFGYEGIKGLK